MYRTVFKVTKDQVAGIGNVVRIFGYNFTGFNDKEDIILLDGPGKHPFNGMPGKFHLPAIHLLGHFWFGGLKTGGSAWESNPPAALSDGTPDLKSGSPTSELSTSVVADYNLPVRSSQANLALKPGSSFSILQLFFHFWVGEASASPSYFQAKLFPMHYNV